MGGKVTQRACSWLAFHAIFAIAGLADPNAEYFLRRPGRMLSVAALLEDNRYLVVHRLLRAVGLGLGLGHGFGFASACADLGLPRSAPAPALVGFNGASKPGRSPLSACSRQSPLGCAALGSTAASS